MSYDAIIIGGGAAGLMCAAIAGQRGRRVLVLEGARQVGRKILMSGGGRCNFTNLYAEPDNFLSANPHFCKSALARYTQWDFLALVEKHGIAWHEKEAGQLFCDESSKQIVRLLLAECERGDVQIRTDCRLDAQDIRHDDPGFRIRVADGELRSRSLVLASGGLSIPKMGATGLAYELARRFGHDIEPTRAALVPLTLSGAPLASWSPLSGLSQAVLVGANGRTFAGHILITHRGLSGPPVLQISSYWEPGSPLTVDWLPGLDAAAALRTAKTKHPRQGLEAWLARRMPRRLAGQLSEQIAWRGVFADARDALLADIGARLNGWIFRPSGSEGYRTAEVTLGGVSTAAVSSASMASDRCPGLYIIGEALDVTGQLGGFNFQWAWASGHAAGEQV